MPFLFIILLTNIYVVALLYVVIGGLAGLGGYLIPERPKLGGALIGLSFALLLFDIGRAVIR